MTQGSPTAGEASESGVPEVVGLGGLHQTDPDPRETGGQRIEEPADHRGLHDRHHGFDPCPPQQGERPPTGRRRVDL